MYTRAIQSSKSKSEAIIRSRLDRILIYVWDEVQRFHHPKGKTRDLKTEWGKTLRIDMTSNGKKKRVTGRADYLIRYDKMENLEVGIVGIEAKKTTELAAAEPQILGYMGMVHTQRKKMQKKDSTVYGVASDSDTFVFYRISNDGEWTSHRLRARERAREGNTLTETFHYNRIINHLAWILRRAMVQSPPTSHEASHVQGSSGESTEDQPCTLPPSYDSDSEMSDASANFTDSDDDEDMVIP